MNLVQQVDQEASLLIAFQRLPIDVLGCMLSAYFRSSFSLSSEPGSKSIISLCSTNDQPLNLPKSGLMWGLQFEKFEQSLPFWPVPDQAGCFIESHTGNE